MRVLSFGSNFFAVIFLVSAIANAGEVPPLPPPGQPQPSDQPSAAAMPSRIYVKYRASTVAVTEASAASLAQQLGKSAGAPVVKYERRPDGLVLTVPAPADQQTLQAIADRIARSNPDVEYAQPDWIVLAEQVNDPLYPKQWDLHEREISIHQERAWQSSTGRGVVVAVLDTGVRPHEDLVKKLLPGYNFVSKRDMEPGRGPDGSDPGDWCPEKSKPSSWHGTHVAGTIAAETNNGKGIAGAAPDAKILPVRVLGHCNGNGLDIADAILWAAGLPVAGVPDNPNPAKVINLSLGSLGRCPPRYVDVIKQAIARGVIIVAAAGNEKFDANLHTPSNCPGAISVAATSRAGGRAQYSNFGGAVTIAAPGGEVFTDLKDNGIYSTLNAGKTEPAEDTYEYYQGTSMAAPHVAGVVALIAQLKPGITSDEVVNVLQSTAQPFPRLREFICTRDICGAGIADAAAAVDAVKKGAAAAMAKEEGPSVKPASATTAGTTPLAGQWIIAGSGEILRIAEGGRWFHPSHGAATIRRAGDDADLKVFYELGSTRCSYRIAFADGGNTLELTPADRGQDPDWCPEGTLKKIGG